MGTNDIPIDPLDQAELLEELNGPPVRRFTTTWELGDLGLFRVYLSIVGPQPQESHRDFPLSRSKLEYILKAVPDVVMFLEEKAR